MTTATIYPSVWGQSGSALDDGVNWISIVTTDATLYIVGDQSGCGATSDLIIDKWIGLSRAYLYFDTSSLPDDCVITGAILYLYGNGVADAAISIYSAVPCADVPSATDHNLIGNTELATPQYLTDTAWYSFNLNSTGLAIISKIGLTKFGIRNSNYDVAIVAPAWEIYESSYDTAWENTLEDYLPYLEITYTSAIVTITTVNAWNITKSTVTLWGNCTGTALKVGFDFGTVPSFGIFEVWFNTSYADFSDYDFSYDLSSLTPNLDYYYRAKATDGVTTWYGDILNFHTLGNYEGYGTGYIWVESTKFHFLDANGDEQSVEGTLV